MVFASLLKLAKEPSTFSKAQKNATLELFLSSLHLVAAINVEDMPVVVMYTPLIEVIVGGASMENLNGKLLG